MRAQILRITAVLILAAGMALCRAGFLDDVFYNIDEAEYAVAADALSSGWLPGVDLLGSSKPPGIVFLSWTFFTVFGRSLSVLHVGQLVIVILAGVFVVEIARRLWGHAAMLPAAVSFWIVSNTFSLPQRILALNVESPGILFTVFALWLLLSFRTAAPLLIAGTALGIAVMFRQSFVFFLLPAAYLVWTQGQRRRTASALVVAGIAAPWLLLLAAYAARGALGWALDSWIRYPLDYAGDIGFTGFLLALWMNTLEFVDRQWPILLLAIAGAAALWRRRHAPETRFLALFAIGSALALSSGSRFTGQYWIQTYPALALFATAGWLALATRRGGFRFALAALVAIGAVLAAGHFPLWRFWDPGAPPKGVSPYAITERQTEIKAGAFADLLTSPGQTILVWGYAPQIYYHARRLPGVRDYIVHYITGYSPGAFDPYVERAPRESGHPRAADLFLEDLQRRRPALIFDMSDLAEGEFPLIQYPLTRYPDVAAHIRANYAPYTDLDGIYVYRLKTSTDSPILPERP